MLIAHTLRLFGAPRGKRKPTADQRLAEIDWPALDWIFASSWAGERREIAPGFDLGAGDWREVVDPETGRTREIDAVDPAYGRKLRPSIWYLERDGDIRIFAAIEVSNGVWVVFVPRSRRQARPSRRGE